MKIVILDRDGVINEDSPNHIKSVAEWRPIAGSLEAIAKLCQAGFRVFVATNQSGLGRGLFDYDAFCAINDRMQKQLAELGGRIDGIAFAPDPPDAPTPRRKPGPGMLLDLARRLNASLDLVPVVGDSWRDIQAARAAQARPVLVRTGNGRRTETEHRTELRGVAVYDDLATFANALIAAQHALPPVR
ncbi:D-glycero-D-manno-heptose 1,7-bisphosphate phosphatase [Fontimonas thermophila]|uniref:D,D-heptose 1,7-bisphosphate phosphatase n=1 Tax=Fontimonas thermophila TaxID=1076937 RepID=A0A1I2GZR6_9GAMM|nr:D-glycero-beta-D-manno-heptose 1,7-bisphosphate 7-phosphatase [Fontimonas thermophila]SFF22247.1 D-glycero-D-manno-heptose 1,7-bisphosphate phosphatase [Fontimonas thermophila]